MAKLSLVPNPTFKASVSISVPGGDAVPVVFEFKHRTKDALKEHLGALEGKSDVEVIQAVAVGWELDYEFNADNIGALAQNYPQVAQSVHNAYVSELLDAKLKN